MRACTCALCGREVLGRIVIGARVDGVVVCSLCATVGEWLATNVDQVISLVIIARGTVSLIGAVAVVITVTVTAVFCCTPIYGAWCWR